LESPPDGLAFRVGSRQEGIELVPPNPQNAIAPGGIRCQIGEDADSACCHILQVPEAAVAVTEACIEDLMSGRHQRQVKTEQDIVTAGSGRCIGCSSEWRQIGTPARRGALWRSSPGSTTARIYPFDRTDLLAVATWQPT
jgi:hypothetical protein